MRLNSSLGTGHCCSTSLLRGLRTPFHERREVLERVGLVKAEIVVQEEEELFLHQVDLGRIEQLGKGSPVLVLGGRVVEVLRCGDQGGEENTVPRAWHPLNQSVEFIEEVRSCSPFAILGSFDRRRSR